MRETATGLIVYTGVTRQCELPFYKQLCPLPADVPIIPDLEDVQEEELTTQVAAPPR